MKFAVFWKDKQGNEHPVKVVAVSHAFSDSRIEIEPPIGADRVHSEEFVVMFLGYLNADTPELHSIESPRLLDSWEKFKREMGK